MQHPASGILGNFRNLARGISLLGKAETSVLILHKFSVGPGPASDDEVAIGVVLDGVSELIPSVTLQGLSLGLVGLSLVGLDAVISGDEGFLVVDSSVINSHKEDGSSVIVEGDVVFEGFSGHDVFLTGGDFLGGTNTLVLGIVVSRKHRVTHGKCFIKRNKL